MQSEVIWGVVKAGSSKCGLDRVAPHDFRRISARLCHQSGQALNKIQCWSVMPPFNLRNVIWAVSNGSEMRSTANRPLSQRRLEHFPFTRRLLAPSRARPHAVWADVIHGDYTSRWFPISPFLVLSYMMRHTVGREHQLATNALM
jgi:hypothetical protein